MIEFYIDGNRVEREEAYEHWISSDTYDRAKPSTRKDIWRVAVYGNRDGNHNPHGEIEHLEEAGITIK